MVFMILLVFLSSTFSIRSVHASQFCICLARSCLIKQATPAAALLSCDTPLYISRCPSSSIISPLTFFLVSVTAKMSILFLLNYVILM